MNAVDRGVPLRVRFQDLLDVATELFSVHGYDGTSVRMLAEGMGIRSGSLYSHIRQKQDVLRELVLSVGEDFLQAARTVPMRDEDAAANLRSLCRAHLEVVHQRHAAVAVYYNEWRRLDPPVQDEIVTLRNQYEGIYLQVLTAGAATGAFRDLDSRMAGLVVLSTLNWASQWYRPDGTLSPGQVAHWCADTILEGVLDGR